MFCGAGGLTNGLEAEGFDVIVGFDLDPSCKYPYEANNFARFHLADVGSLGAEVLEEAWQGTSIRVLSGCAPCQPFSKYTQGITERDERWNLLDSFSRLITDTRPALVTMENVPELARHEVHTAFVDQLKAEGYTVSENIVECVDYGIPQQRRRLVLLASVFGEIELVDPSAFGSRRATVRETIGDLPKIKAGIRTKLIQSTGAAACRGSTLSESALRAPAAAGPTGHRTRRAVSYPQEGQGLSVSLRPHGMGQTRTYHHDAGLWVRKRALRASRAGPCALAPRSGHASDFPARLCVRATWSRRGDQDDRTNDRQCCSGQARPVIGRSLRKHLTKFSSSGILETQLGWGLMPLFEFSVDAALLRELGERLVGQPHIALAELIKNSYDADSHNIDVSFDGDKIVVTDDGDGMSTSTFKNFWMRVGSPHKQEIFETKLGRRPTGSKGIGRLAVQFLGSKLEIRTTRATIPRRRCTLPWIGRWQRVRRS